MKVLIRRTTAAFLSISIANAAFGGPEKDPLYYCQIGVGGLSRPFGFAVFDDRTYLFFGVDEVWAQVHWLVPTFLFLVAGGLLAYATVRACKGKKPNQPPEPMSGLAPGHGSS